MNLKEIVEQSKWCNYECEAGSLQNNAAFIEIGTTILYLSKVRPNKFKRPVEVKV